MERALKRYAPLFVLPTVLAFAIGFLFPFLQGIYLSFCQFTTVSDATWTGIGNYQRAFADAQFLKSFWFTVAFAVVSIVLINVIAFALALLLTRKLKGTNLFRTVFFMPNLIGGIVLGYIWQILINCLLSLAGRPLLALNSAAGYWGLIVLMCWQQVGYMMIIYIAGIQNVPGELIEAAKIDGCTAFKALIHITLPLIRPTLLVVCVTVSITAFGQFSLPYSLTGGGPQRATQLIGLYMHEQAFTYNELSYGATIGVLIFAINIVMTLIYNRVLRQDG